MLLSGFLILAIFSFEHFLKWKDPNRFLNVTNKTVFCWELSKTHSLKWLHTLKVSTVMLKLVHLPYSAQGLVCADLCHLDCFLCYCLSVTEPSLRFLGLKGWGKGFLPLCLAIFIYVFSYVLCIRGHSHKMCFCIPLSCFSIVNTLDRCAWPLGQFAFKKRNTQGSEIKKMQSLD